MSIKLKGNLQPKVSVRQRQNTLIIYTATGIAVSVITGIVLFFSLNLGRTEEALAANFSTTQSGNWSSGVTWNTGSEPNDWGYHDITLNHNITGTSTTGPNKLLRGFNSITLTSGNTFTSTGDFSLDFVSSFLTNGGDVVINGDLTLTNSTNFTIESGNLTILGDLTISNSSSLTFNSSGSMTVTGGISYSGGGPNSLNINSGSFSVTNDISLSSASSFNLAEGIIASARDLYQSNNDDAVANINGILNLTGDVNVGGTVNIGINGEINVPNGDVILRNTGGTDMNVYGNLDVGGSISVAGGGGETDPAFEIFNGGNVDVGESFDMGPGTYANIDGYLDVADDVTIFGGSQMNGAGILEWDGNLDIINSNINNYTEVNEPSPLDLSTMTNVILPVELISFNAQKANDQVVLTWQTASEKNNDYFTIERSTNGVDYTSIAEVTGSGTTKDITSYEYEDTNPINGLSYYRLKQTDFDGTTETFRPVSVKMEVESSNAITIFPNPIIDYQITVKMDKAEEGVITIFNQNGTKVITAQLSGFSKETEIKLPSDLKAGVYIANIKTNNTKESMKLLKN